MTEFIYEGGFEALWDCKECGAYLNLTSEAVAKQARAGIIPGFKIGKYWRFSPPEIRDFVKRHGAL